MNRNRILTVTLNPALDMTGSLGLLEAGEVNLINEGSLHPAGKGVNVARVLSDLGTPVTVSGCLGDENLDTFIQLFKSMDARDEFVRVHGASRINVKLVEADGRVTDINFPGVAVSPEKAEEMETRLFELAASHDYIVIAGSLPPGISPELFSEWLKGLREQGKKVALDTSGAALTAGLSVAPWLVKPNEVELSAWAGKPLDDEASLMAAGEELAATGIEHVVISRGAEGVLWLNNGNWLKAVPPKMKVVSTVGAGDTLVAGMCWGLYKENTPQDVLAFATALSALAVSQVGVGVPDISDVKALADRVEMNALAGKA